MKRSYDLSAHQEELKEGDFILVRKPQKKKYISQKLSSNWIKLVDGLIVFNAQICQVRKRFTSNLPKSLMESYDERSPSKVNE